jgi:hypothetical protein
MCARTLANNLISVVRARALPFRRVPRPQALWVPDARARALVGVVMWASLIVVAHIWGDQLLARPEPDMDLNAPPLFGRFNLQLSIGVLAPATIGMAIAIFGPRLARCVTWRALLLAGVVASSMWAGSVAVSEGWFALARPLEHPTSYGAALPLESPSLFVDGFIDEIQSLPLHVQSHPPGATLFVWMLDGVRLHASAVASVISLCGASAVAAALLAVREVAGEHVARSCWALFVLAPTALWAATSLDAVFMGVSAWGLAMMIVATGRRGVTADSWAAAGGVLFGGALMMSYGVAPLALVVLPVAAARRRVRPVVVGCISVLAVLTAFGAVGFWWFDGLAAATERYRAGISSARPDDYFLVANLAALAVALGPAVVAGMFTQHDKRLSMIVIPAFAVVLLADLSGLSKGEVERIWLPFTPWLLPAGAFLPGPHRAWLVAQVTWTIMIQVGVQTPW